MQAKCLPYLGYRANSQCTRVCHNTLPPDAASRSGSVLSIYSHPTSQGIPTNKIEISICYCSHRQNVFSMDSVGGYYPASSALLFLFQIRTHNSPKSRLRRQLVIMLGSYRILSVSSIARLCKSMGVAPRRNFIYRDTEKLVIPNHHQTVTHFMKDRCQLFKDSTALVRVSTMLW